MEDSLQLRGVTPPNSVEAERSVLGAMLQDSTARCSRQRKSWRKMTSILLPTGKSSAG